MKMRIRWYGKMNGEIEKPVLELKQKNGLTGSKSFFTIPSFNINDIYNPGFLSSLFQKSNLDLRKKTLPIITLTGGSTFINPDKNIKPYPRISGSLKIQ